MYLNRSNFLPEFGFDWPQLDAAGAVVVVVVGGRCCRPVCLRHVQQPMQKIPSKQNETK